MYVKSSLTVIERADLKNVSLEIVWIEVRTSSRKSLLICTVYRPPPQRDDDYFNLLIDNFEYILSLSVNVLILGDLNIDIETSIGWKKQYV